MIADIIGIKNSIYTKIGVKANMGRYTKILPELINDAIKTFGDETFIIVMDSDGVIMPDMLQIPATTKIIVIKPMEDVIISNNKEIQELAKKKHHANVLAHIERLLCDVLFTDYVLFLPSSRDDISLDELTIKPKHVFSLTQIGENYEIEI